MMIEPCFLLLLFTQFLLNFSSVWKFRLFEANFIRLVFSLVHWMVQQAIHLKFSLRKALLSDMQ